MQDKQYPLMTAEDISQEIFGGKITARQIRDRQSKRPGFPNPVGDVGKLFWRRTEIMQYFGITQDKKAA